MIKNFDDEKEKIFLLSIDIWNEEPFLEVVVVNKNMTYLEVKNVVAAFLNSQEGQERDSDDQIISYLIDKKIIKDVINYEYLPI